MPEKKIIGLIPTRLGSTRIPKKALINIDGLPMIVHTMKRAQLCSDLDRVIVCTDSMEIKKVVEKYGGEAILTKKTHKTGTDRISEVAKKINFDLAIDIQGDFPLLDPKSITKLIKFHKKNNNFDIVVPSSPLKDPAPKSIVKVLMADNKSVLYLTRAEAPYPYYLKPSFFLKHMSIISFKRNSLINFNKLKQTKFEKIEGVELLRAIENNYEVGSFIINKDIFSVDVKKDYLRAIDLMPYDPIRKKY
jgi:3-deoxy-manno-octulosonate cytidylyltransferase (CMP-KDO synthetase)